MQPVSPSRRGWQIALYALLCVRWGSTWLVIKVGYGGLGPFNVASLRFFFAGAVLAVMMPLLGAPPVNDAFQYLVGNTAILPTALYAVLVGAGFGEEVLTPQRP